MHLFTYLTFLEELFIFFYPYFRLILLLLGPNPHSECGFGSRSQSTADPMRIRIINIRFATAFFRLQTNKRENISETIHSFILIWAKRKLLHFPCSLKVKFLRKYRYRILSIRLQNSEKYQTVLRIRIRSDPDLFGRIRIRTSGTGSGFGSGP
jgi:hypothetical protein